MLALIITAALFAAAGIAALAGKRQTAKVPPPAGHVLDSVKTDVATVEEAGHRDHTHRT